MARPGASKLCYIVPTAMAEDKPAKKPESTKSADAKKAEAKTESKDKESKPAPAKADASTKAGPKFDPKPVNVGGESILERLLPHMKKIAIGAGVAVVIVMIGVLVLKMKERKVIAETGNVAKVIDEFDKPVRAPNTPADPILPSYASEADRAKAVVDAIAKNDADKVGAPFRGAQLVAAGKIDDAIALLRGAQKDAGLDGVLARENLGLALEAKAATEKDPAARQKDLEDALATFQQMQPDDKGPRRVYALYHQGRMLSPGLLNKPADARAAFQRAKDIAKDTDLQELIEERLAMLGDS